MQRAAPSGQRSHSPVSRALVYGTIAFVLIAANVKAAEALAILAPKASLGARLAVAVLASATAIRLLTVVTKAIVLPALTKLESSLRTMVTNLEARGR